MYKNEIARTTETAKTKETKKTTVKKWSFILLAAILPLVMAGCQAQQPISANSPYAAQQETICQYIESDNQYGWGLGSCVEVDASVYYVTVQVNDAIVNDKVLNGAGSYTGFNGFGSGYMRIWEEGKGILPVIVRTIDPEFDSISTGDTILLKTVDRKAMGLPNGAITQFICNKNAEVLSPNKSGMVLTDDRVTFELDDCRMVSPEYTLVGGGESETEK